MEKPLVNRVANSGLITINLENFFPAEELVAFDLKDYLFMELILKEKDFRAALNDLDWSAYEGKNLAVFCSTDAIVPVWAYMLVASKATPYATKIFFGDEQRFYESHYEQVLEDLDCAQYDDKRIVIKGCSQKPVPPSAYLTLTRLLRPYAKSIMYGEPCSTVPIFKKPRVVKK
ncbi:MAG: DUF2480 family protein [Bacteroidota bacterium]